MSDEEPNDGGLEAGLRWVLEQLSRSVEQLEDLDFDAIARATGIDADRAREFLTGAGQWLNQADGLASDAAIRFTNEAVLRFSGLVSAAANGQAAPSGSGPHPLDRPTPGQGLALSAIDSGRWTIEPGSHVITTEGEGPAPDDAVGLVGELRARDWINADGELTVAGRHALKRWIEQTDAS